MKGASACSIKRTVCVSSAAVEVTMHIESGFGVEIAGLLCMTVLSHHRCRGLANFIGRVVRGGI